MCENVTYGVVATVKSILQDSTVTYESEIAACITSSDAYVVSLLAQKGLTVPSPTPQNIIDASNYFAAWMFRKKRDPQSSWIFYTDGERFLNAYCDSVLAVHRNVGKVVVSLYPEEDEVEEV